MPSPIVGLHRVTAIASDPQRTLDFWYSRPRTAVRRDDTQVGDSETYHFHLGMMQAKHEQA
jgi:glyoxalase family protein